MRMWKVCECVERVECVREGECERLSVGRC